MNSMADINNMSNSEMASRLRAALVAIEHDDAEALDTAVNSILATVQRPLAMGVARLARDVRQTLQELDLDSRIVELKHASELVIDHLSSDVVISSAFDPAAAERMIVRATEPELV